MHVLASTRARIGRRIGTALVAAGVTLGMVSCGSRTGLFGPDPGLLLTDASKDGGNDATDDGPVPCVPGEFTFELALTQLMFVVDRSGSMKFSLDGRTEVPRGQWRWTILQNALRKTITTFDQQIAMGVKFFPEVLRQQDLFDSERACQSDVGVGIAPARGNAPQILGVFDSTEPRGGTPTSEAVRQTAEFLQQRRSVARTIVLATDGAPNCNAGLDSNSCVCTSTQACDGTVQDRGRYSCLDDLRTIGVIRNVSENNKIPVYVIGIGSTERPEFLKVLDDMAVAGGRPRPTVPRHYNVQSENGLTDALTSIRDTVAKCTYLTPSAPTDPNKISVQIDGVPVPRDQTKTDGWDWVDQTFGELAFFGDACRRAQGAGGPPAVINGVVRCE